METSVKGGVRVGSFGFADLANFWFGFSVFAFKMCGFPVLVTYAACGFLQFRVWFSIFVKNHGSFSDSSV